MSCVGAHPLFRYFAGIVIGSVISLATGIPARQVAVVLVSQSALLLAIFLFDGHRLTVGSASNEQ